MPALDIRSLTVCRGMNVAVDDVSFSVESGESVVLLGPDGAGKSTLCRVMSGLMPPTDGTVYVQELDVRQVPARVRFLSGFLMSDAAVSPRLSARENVRLIERFRGVSRRSAAEATGHLLGRVELADAADLPAARLQPGDRRRLALAMAMAGNPFVVYFDEPTRGLEPYERRRLWDSFSRLRGRTTFVFATDDPYEAAVLGDRVVILSRGRLCAVGDADELCEAVGEKDIGAAYRRWLEKEKGGMRA